MARSPLILLTEFGLWVTHRSGARHRVGPTADATSPRQAPQRRAGYPLIPPTIHTVEQPPLRRKSYEQDFNCRAVERRDQRAG
jgi:hypothetical protein